jgi:cystathionine beta-synthase
MKYSQNVLDLIGRTPLVKIHNGVMRSNPLMLLKLEFLNPGGSVKDRMASYILLKAVREGKLKKGDTVIDNSSGNTGVAMAMVAAVLGLKAIITTPEKTSKEKVDLIKSYGADVIITPDDAAHEDPEGSYMKAVILARENGYFHLNQYHNQDNLMSHYYSTGPEIWEDTDGRVTHIVAGIGTGGTLTGTARYLKEKNPAVKAIAVDPVGSIFAGYIKENKAVEPAAYKIEGIGSDCITQALHPDVIDEVMTVRDDDAFETARAVSCREGISVGGSSGAAVWAARKLAPALDQNAVIVVIAPDGGIRYLSKCYNDIWMMEHGFLKKKSNKEILEV